LTTAVVECARRYMAAQLRAERAACAVRDHGYDEYQARVDESLDALQHLRDALFAERTARDAPDATCSCACANHPSGGCGCPCRRHPREAT
jgi:hypothetical protein